MSKLKKIGKVRDFEIATDSKTVDIVSDKVSLSLPIEVLREILDRVNDETLRAELGEASVRMKEKGFKLDDGIYCGPLDGDPSITYDSSEGYVFVCHDYSETNALVVRIGETEVLIGMEHLECMLTMQRIWNRTKKARGLM